MRLRFETILECNWIAIKNSFGHDLLQTLAPPGVKLSLERFDGCSPGDEVHLELNSFGLKQKWVSVITRETSNDAEWSFVDEGRILPWPLVTWQHLHRVVPLDLNSSRIIDDITFQCNYPWMDILMYPVLWASFAVRPPRYRKYFKDNK